MADLYLSLCAMSVLCTAAAVAGARVAGRGDRWLVVRFQVLLGLLLILYMSCVWDRPLLAQLVPCSSLIVLGNWLPVIGCGFAGVCLQTRSIRLWRRLGLVTVTGLLAGYSLARPLLGEPPRGMPLSRGSTLQFQTDDHTCSAAAAASLLRIHGVPATETEMARLCLTREGTHWQGVYRGLKIKLSNTGWDVVAEDFRCPAARTSSRPMLGVLSLTFMSGSGSQALASGWATDAGHSVVALEYLPGDRLRVFDPSPEFGLEAWDQAFLGGIRSGVLLRLVPRGSALMPAVDLQQVINHALDQSYARSGRF